MRSDFEAGLLDLGLFSALSCSELFANGYEPLAQVNFAAHSSSGRKLEIGKLSANTSKSSHLSLLASRHNEISELIDKPIHLAFTTSDSTSGYALPLVELRKLGIKVKDMVGCGDAAGVLKHLLRAPADQPTIGCFSDFDITAASEILSDSELSDCQRLTVVLSISVPNAMLMARGLPPNETLRSSMNARDLCIYNVAELMTRTKAEPEFLGFSKIDDRQKTVLQDLYSQFHPNPSRHWAVGLILLGCGALATVCGIGSPSCRSRGSGP